ncbi:MAG: DUF4440 domain-containing protein [Opitutaceae bacterium]|nr:DUF4440 domain-containing protein [Opitutaceae bacterium]
MRTAISLILAAALTGLVFAQSTQQSEPSGIERQPLEHWLGDWTYQSTTHNSPLGAGGTSLGTCSVRPILAGQFVEFRGKETGPDGSLQWIETDGFDPARGCFFWSSFASDGSVIDATYTFDGPRVAVTGTLLAGDKRYRLRGLVTFADDFQSLTDKREISTDGVHWTLLSENRAAKIIPVLAAPDSVEQELVALENAWAAAYVAADVKMLDRLEAEEWICTSAKGEVIGKADDLRDLADGSFKATVFEMSDLKVQIYGDTAVITGRQTEKATYKGEDASAVHRITDVWLRRDGRWQAIASHLSREAAAP